MIGLAEDHRLALVAGDEHGEQQVPGGLTEQPVGELGVAAPAFGISFVCGLARMLKTTDYYIHAHWFHGKLLFAFVVIGLHHVIGARARRLAQNSGSNVLRQGHADSQIFWATVSYQALDWLGVSLSLITASPQRHPDGTPRQPFLSVDYNAFSQVSFGATVSLEKAAAKLIK